MTHINGRDGVFLFPVTTRVTYVIRDNSKNKTHKPFDLFIVTGNHPTHLQFDHSQYIASVSNYKDACLVVEQTIERAEKLIQQLK